MELKELINNLIIENTIILYESGPDSILRHYTTLPGLIGILNKEKIMNYGYSDSKNNEVAVIRSSGDIKNIENISNDKNIIGYFEIKFHILNDKVKNIKKRKTNEPYHTYNRRISIILNKYNIKNKDDVIKDCSIIKNILSNTDYELLIDLIHDMKLSLKVKEGEERIISSIPLNEKYMIFKFIKNINIDNLGDKSNKTLKYFISQFPNLFENNEYLKNIKI